MFPVFIFLADFVWYLRRKSGTMLILLYHFELEVFKQLPLSENLSRESYNISAKVYFSFTYIKTDNKC